MCIRDRASSAHSMEADNLSNRTLESVQRGENVVGEDVYKRQVLKGSAFEELKLALEAVKKGEVYLSSSVSQVLVREFLKLEPSSEIFHLIEKLTPREREIIQLLAEGRNRNNICLLYTSTR